MRRIRSRQLSELYHCLSQQQQLPASLWLCYVSKMLKQHTNEQYEMLSAHLTWIGAKCRTERNRAGVRSTQQWEVSPTQHRSVPKFKLFIWSSGRPRSLVFHWFSAQMKNSSLKNVKVTVEGQSLKQLTVRYSLFDCGSAIFLCTGHGMCKHVWWSLRVDSTVWGACQSRHWAQSMKRKPKKTGGV